ncbi:MAG: group II intron reverse transcriptase/maturase [Chitinophagales bacterium]
MKLFETETLRGKTQPITLEEIAAAYRKVKSNGGAAGVDGKTLEAIEADKVRMLYKLWNRMASGSYFPQCVKGVEIPKSDGTKRLLGIPTVTDRIAQQVAVSVIEPIMERLFHADSYGYRPNKSAHDAVAKCEERCYKYRWVIDMDIKGFFDNIPHDKMMEVLKHYISEKWIWMYVERWLKCPMQMPDGSIAERTKGTPQGGVISPILANMYLHVVFDQWMQKHYANTEYGSIRWERYADDIIVHCNNEKQAKYLLNRIKERFADCGLTLHPVKTKIVYCKQNNRRGGNKSVRFDFLGFTFQPRRMYHSKGKEKGKRWLGFAAAISRKASKHLKAQVRKRKIHRATGAELQDIANSIAPMVRGWIYYYGRFRPSALREVFSALNERLVRWLTNKYKRYRRRMKEARTRLKEIAKDFPNLFVHWQYGYTP